MSSSPYLDKRRFDGGDAAATAFRRTMLCACCTRGPNLHLNDHFLEPGRILVQNLAGVLADHYCVGMPEAAKVRIVNSGLAAERHSFAQYCFIAFSDPR